MEKNLSPMKCSIERPMMLNLKIHGRIMQITSNVSEPLDELSKAYDYFLLEGEHVPESVIDLRLTERENSKMQSPPHKSLILRKGSDGKSTLYSFKKLRLVFREYGKTYAMEVLDLKARKYSIFTNDLDMLYELGWVRLEEAISLTMLKHELIRIHAAAVSSGDIGVLFPADTGGGKTTIAIALASKGFYFLSDDSGIICPHTLRIFEFPRSIRVDEETLQKFPELREFVQEPKYKMGSIFSIRERHVLNPRRFFNIGNDVKLKLILFPRLWNCEESATRIISRTRAKRLLMENVKKIQLEMSKKRKMSKYLSSILNETVFRELRVGHSISSLQHVVSCAIEEAIRG